MFTESLRPRTSAELLDQALRVYRRYFLKFTGVVALAVLPFALLQALASALNFIPLAAQFTAPQTFESILPFSSLGSVTLQLAGGILHFVLVQGLATACLTQAIKDDLLGQSVGIVATFKRLKACWGELAIALLLTYGLVTFGTVVILIPCLGWFFGLGAFIFFSAAVMQVLIPVVIFEQHRSIATSIRRAWDLTRQRFWGILRFWIVLGMFQQVLSAGPIILLVGVLFWVINGLATSPAFAGMFVGGQVVFQSVFIAFTNVLWVPLQVAAVNMLYLDLRVRADGLDLAWQAARLTQHAPVEVLQTATTSNGPWFRQEDRRNFILLSLLMFGLVFVVIVLYFMLIFSLVAMRDAF